LTSDGGGARRFKERGPKRLRALAGVDFWNNFSEIYLIKVETTTMKAKNNNRAKT
jgi:hypothetical protein